MKRNIVTVIAIILGLWVHGTCFAWGLGSKGTDDKGLIVDIDNPNFKKLTIAIPTFLIRPGVKSLDAARFATEGPVELTRLLTFSGLFNVMNDAGYKEAYTSLAAGYKTSNGRIVVNATGGTPVGSVNTVAWKGLGVEALMIGELFEENGNLSLNVRTYDINMGKELKGVQFSMIALNYLPVLRRVGDIVLDLYTGKGGIFNSKIVFIGRRTKSSVKQIFVCDFDGSNLLQISNTNAIHLSAHWSPDGEHITGTSYENGNPDLFIYDVVKTKSGGIRPGMKHRLSSLRGLNSGAQWAPSGKVIAYTGEATDNADIYSITPDGKERTRVIGGHGLDVDPSFSPDNKYLAFVSGRFGNPHIFTANIRWQSDTKFVVDSDKRLTYAGWYNATPAWSPDSQKIAFAGYDKDIHRWDLFVMNFDGTNMERLTLRFADSQSPSWSPNGQMLVFNSNRVDNKDVKDMHHIFWMNRDGSNQRMMMLDLYEARTPEWSRNIFGETTSR